MIRLRMFGQIELHDSTGRELRSVLAQPKRLALLAYLAATPRAFHRRDTLLALLWTELDESRGRTALNQAIRFLRRELGWNVIVSRGAEDVGVDSTCLWCDAAAFHEHAEAGRHAEALELYRGDLLVGVFAEGGAGFEEWLEQERVQLRAIAAKAARALAEVREQDGNLTTAVACARRAVELSDHDERVMRGMLELLERLGDRAGAIHAYDLFARKLAEDFGATPDPETEALIDRIRQRAAGMRGVPTQAGAAAGRVATATSVGGALGAADAAKHMGLVGTFSPPLGHPGTELGGWRIERELGRGGMATVYLARDPKHDRTVALKVLRRELALSSGAERFLREIQIMARLAHPHVLPLIDSGAADGALYLVAPYIAGGSLRERLTREGWLGVDEALAITRGVASALDYAHGQGVVHRDIKPANILLEHDRAVVGDFGMARAMTAAASSDLTETGLALGTASYMSPEQVNAERTLDGRSDVYSLACVVYEMLAGEPPFTGPTQQAIIARHAQEPPRSLRVVRPTVPRGVERAVEKALAKVPADRFATAGEFLAALEAGLREDGDSSSVVDDVPPVRPAARRVLPWAVAGAVSLVALAAGVGWWRAAQTPPRTVLRFEINGPPGEPLRNESIALSRDGRLVAFLAGPRARLYLRRLDQLEAIVRSRVSPPFDLHFSPDGKSLLYTRGSGPLTISTAPGDTAAEPTKLWTLRGPGWGGIGWMDSSSVLQIFADTVWRVPIGGGAPTALAGMDTLLDAQWRQPVILPDGKTIAVRVTLRDAESPNDDRLALVPIGGGARTLLDFASKGVIGFVDGVLIFGSVDGRIMGVRFDLARRRPLGTPVELVDAVDIGTGGPMADVSDNGTLAYMVTTPRPLTQIIDERGSVVREVADSRRYYQTRWSPDGKRIALYTIERDQLNIGVYDVERGHLTTLPWTTGGFFPTWTPDGRRVAFTGWAPGMRTGGRAMWTVADGRSTPEPIPGTSSFGAKIIHSAFSPDGKYAVVRPQTSAGEPAGARHAFAVPLAGGPAIPIVHGAQRPDHLAVSPNGKWIAYSAADTGGQPPLVFKPPQVYVEPFPTGSGRVHVSVETGFQPRWSGDGRALFYTSNRKIRRATLDVSGALPRVVRTDSLFFDQSFSERPIVSWDVHPDGKHFVMTRDVGGSTRLIVVENWMTEVRARLARAK